MGRLDGHKALITGGASGIGAATARMFMEQGALVVITDIDEDRGLAMAEELGVDCTFFPHDVTSEASWQRVVTQAQQAQGGLDVVINSAGVSSPASVEDASLTHWRQVMSINCDGVFLGCKYGIRAMKETGGGAIVNLSSALVARADSDFAAYCASKAAVLAITRSTALHCAEKRYGIRCNAVLPGATETPMYEGKLAAAGDREAVRTSPVAASPMGHAGSAEDIAWAIIFLASKESAFVTGAELPVDGGFLV